MKEEVLEPREVMLLLSIECQRATDIMLQLRRGRKESKKKNCAISARSQVTLQKIVNMELIDIIINLLMSNLFKRKNKEESFSLKDPDALTSYYMDTMMCSNFYDKHQECLG